MHSKVRESILSILNSRNQRNVMAITFKPTDTAIIRGIKLAGIGKKGSQPLPNGLIAEIIEELKSGQVPLIAQGAFFGGLMMKGVTNDELRLEEVFAPGALQNPQQLVSCLAHDAPPDIQIICTQLLKGETLTKDTAAGLGKFMLSEFPGDGARGLVVSILRVRYETMDEYEALLKTAQETIAPAFQTSVPAGDSIIQLAEPFDGVDQSYMLTPLLGKYLQSLNYRAVHLVGRSSGPKLCFNLLDVIKAMDLRCIQGNQDLSQPKPHYGYFISQQDLSKPLDRWVDLRRQTIKRPYFATLEKFLNPAKAKISITSAYHPPYSEKMATVAERAGFPGSIVVRNGLEGSLAFPLKRPVKILCSARQNDGSYKREELTLDPAEYLKTDLPFEEKVENPTAADNARLIQEFDKTGKTPNNYFNERVRLSCAGIKIALDWVERNLLIKGGNRS